MKSRWMIAVVVAGISFFAWNWYSSHSSATTPVQSSHFRKVADGADFGRILDSIGTGLVVFDLYADWCGPCRKLHPTLAALAQDYAGKVPFYRINVDENQGVATAFKVDGIPYVVFVKNREVVGSLLGLNPAGEYEKIIRANIPATTTEKSVNTL